MSSRSDGTLSITFKVKMRVTLVIFSLAGGGAQRVLSSMANYWAVKGWQITLLTYDDGHKATCYGLHPAVMHRPLGIESRSKNLVHGMASNLKRLSVLRRAIKMSNPHVVISFLDRINVRAILAGLGLDFPVIVSERIDPAHHSIGMVWSTLRRWSYRYARCIVAQTSDALGYFSPAIRLRGRVIPNPLSSPPDCGNIDARKRAKTVMGMGRLTHQKGFDLLLRAFSDIAPKHNEWSLVIWGEGDLRVELEVLRDELGLQGRVSFSGWTGAPFKEMRRAGLFVLSSRYEGFPNVLCEAMACGLPVVSFDCPSGPSEIIRDGVDGILVPPDDVQALATVMDRLMEDHSERTRLAIHAPDVITRFGVEKVMGMWEAVLYDAIELQQGKAGPFT